MRTNVGFFARFGGKVVLMPLASLAVAVLVACSGVGPEEPVGAARQASCTPTNWNAYDGGTSGTITFWDGLYPTNDCGYAIIEVDNFSHTLNPQNSAEAQWHDNTAGYSQQKCEASNVFYKDYVLVNGSWTFNYQAPIGFGRYSGGSCTNPAFASDTTHISPGNSYLIYAYAATCQYHGGVCTVNNNCCSSSCSVWSSTLNSWTCASGGSTPELDEDMDVYTF